MAEKTVWAVTTADGKKEVFGYLKDAMAYADGTGQSYSIIAEWLPDILETTNQTE